MKLDNLDDPLDTCEHCGEIYNPDEEGHTHTPDCVCKYCDSEHIEYDHENGAIIQKYVEMYGEVSFCSQECESKFIQIHGDYDYI